MDSKQLFPPTLGGSASLWWSTTKMNGGSVTPSKTVPTPPHTPRLLMTQGNRLKRSVANR